jgi:hypothetical protein
MLAQFGGDRVGHDLTTINLGRLAPIYRSVPTRVLISVNGHPEIACADPLLHYVFELDRSLLLLIHAAKSF